METLPSTGAQLKSISRQISGHDEPKSKRKSSGVPSVRSISNVEAVSRQPTKIQSISHPSYSNHTSGASRADSSNRSVRSVPSIKNVPRQSTTAKTPLTPSGSLSIFGDRRTTPWERAERTITPCPSGSKDMLSTGPPDTSHQSTTNLAGVASKPPESTKAKGALNPARKTAPAAISKVPQVCKGRTIYKAKQSRRRHLPVLREAEEPKEAGGALVRPRGAVRVHAGLQPSDEDTWKWFAITAESLDALVDEDVDGAGGLLGRLDRKRDHDDSSRIRCFSWIVLIRAFEICMT
ncbi:hypothetical protein MMC34_004291 [Xylographa carneopallida]|nr:hypothetical protein [Xylographa carneopallida]